MERAVRAVKERSALCYKQLASLAVKRSRNGQC
jgi:hypothetical protein